MMSPLAEVEGKKLPYIPWNTGWFSHMVFRTFARLNITNFKLIAWTLVSTSYVQSSILQLDSLKVLGDPWNSIGEHRLMLKCH